MHPVEFQSGNETLRGRLHMPRTDAKTPGILILPGFADTAGGMHDMHAHLAKALQRSGFTVLRFDYRGLGESDGDFREFTVQFALEDAWNALALLRRRPEVNAEVIGVSGFSLGGALAAQLASRLPEIRAMCLWAPVAFPERVFNGFFNEAHKAQGKSRGWMDWMGWAVGHRFLTTAGSFDPLAAIEQSRAEALVLHGTSDQEVLPENASAYGDKGCDVRWLDGGDHLFSSVTLEEQAISATVDWFSDKLLTNKAGYSL